MFHGFKILDYRNVSLKHLIIISKILFIYDVNTLDVSPKHLYIITKEIQLDIFHYILNIYNNYNYSTKSETRD